MTEAYNTDCMEYMRSLPDNAFDLAVCDPPYGDGVDKAAFREQGVHFNGRGRSANFDKQEERFATRTAQTSLFVDGGFT